MPKCPLAFQVFAWNCVNPLLQLLYSITIKINNKTQNQKLEIERRVKTFGKPNSQDTNEEGPNSSHCISHQQEVLRVPHTDSERVAHAGGTAVVHQL